MLGLHDHSRSDTGMVGTSLHLGSSVVYRMRVGKLGAEWVEGWGGQKGLCTELTTVHACIVCMHACACYIIFVK